MIHLLHQDTDKNVLETTRRYLEKDGRFSVCSLDSLNDALKSLENRRFDVIVSGQPDGIELLKVMKTRDSVVPFIFFSEPMGGKTVIEALNLGADYFLVKEKGSEAEFARLQHLVERVIARPKMKGKIQDSVKITEENPAPVVRVSKEGILLYANPAAYPLLEKWGVTLGSVLFDLVKGTVNKSLFNSTLIKTEIEPGEKSYLFTFRPGEYESSLSELTEKKKDFRSITCQCCPERGNRAEETRRSNNEKDAVIA